MNNWSGCSMASAPDITREETAEPPAIDEHLVSLIAPVSYEAERYRMLAHLIELLQKDSGLHVLAVTSPTVGDGKTTTAIKLPAAVARTPQSRVLLAWRDLCRPRM